jgi:hypothetical protein
MNTPDPHDDSRWLDTNDLRLNYQEITCVLQLFWGSGILSFKEDQKAIGNA